MTCIREEEHPLNTMCWYCEKSRKSFEFLVNLLDPVELNGHNHSKIAFLSNRLKLFPKNSYLQGVFVAPVHLFALNDIVQVCLQFERLYLNHFGSGLLAFPIIFTSSANIFVEEFIVSGRSLIKIKNIRDRKTEPWGTPDLTVTQNEVWLPTRIAIHLSDRKSSIILNNVPEMHHDSNLDSNLPSGTEPNAFSNGLNKLDRLALPLPWV